MGEDSQGNDRLASEVVRVRLYGLVRYRPRMLNPVGTGVMLGRKIPVHIGDVHAGIATTEQYPDVKTTEACFDAELDPQVAPPAWHGREVPFLAVEQSQSWPGPAPRRIVVDPNAEPRADVTHDV